jgi:hypothetical protein
MHLQAALLVSALTAGSAAASSGRIGSFTLPLERRQVSKNEQGDEAVTSIYGGVDWVTGIKLGNQDMRIQIDTGSADLYVYRLGPFCCVSANLLQLGC